MLNGDVEEVEDTVVAHHGQATVTLVERDRLDLLVHLDFGQAQVTVKVLRYHFQERQSTPDKNVELEKGGERETYPDFLLAPSVFF